MITRTCARAGCGYEFVINDKQKAKKYCSQRCLEMAQRRKASTVKPPVGRVLFRAKQNTEVTVHPNLQSKMPQEPCKFTLLDGRAVATDGKRHDGKWGNL